MKWCRTIILNLWAVFSVLHAAPNEQGVIISPRITIEGKPDYTDLRRFVAFFEEKGLQGQDLAIALWRYLSGTETGLYHFHTIIEGADTDYALGNSRDPLKNMNVHNHGFCGIHGPVLAGVFREAGFEARNFSVPAWKHTATEVFYDGTWHYFDLDLRGALMRPDGVIASAAEAAEQEELWIASAERINPCFPNIRSMSHGFEKFAEGPLHKQYHWSIHGWTTDYVLRPGESITRWWDNQGGRWHHSPDYVGRKRELLEQRPRGIKPHISSMSLWGVGSALIRYEPDLTGATKDLELGCYQVQNLCASSDGLTLIRPGQGCVVFEVLSPYIIVPIMEDLDIPGNYALNSDAATVMVKARGPVKGEVSTDGGLTWEGIGTLRDSTRIDLTRFVHGRYRYLIRLVLEGQPGKSLLDYLELRTWGQVAPISLPRLAKGRNVLHLDVNDPRGQATRLLPVLPQLGDAQDIQRYGIKITGVYRPENVTQRLVGQATVPVRAPEGCLIEWLTVGGMFRAHRTEKAHLTANKMEVSVSPDGPFRTVYDAIDTVPDWNEHWHYAMDVDVELEESVREVYVRYTGDPGLNAIRIYAHYRDPRPANKGVLRVTHEYAIADERILKEFELPASGSSYSVECPASPTNLSIALAAPHSCSGEGKP